MKAQVYAIQRRLDGVFYRSLSIGVSTFSDAGTRVLMTEEVARIWFRARLNEIVLVRA